ncbi:unnamed protein product [Didymodactylos carnosus]|uniref:Uncharacterized protein n=1 Tax=Didymodactylos carnosus TaxID=1234261 RepID=A0A814VJZ1_9BILA|nr:unnamed protein product [Didymodactylos carnosus]CAF3952401.1 unnamed protein product [Didymodactylos carnosus]
MKMSSIVQKNTEELTDTVLSQYISRLHDPARVRLSPLDHAVPEIFYLLYVIHAVHRQHVNPAVSTSR